MGSRDPALNRRHTLRLTSSRQASHLTSSPPQAQSRISGAAAEVLAQSHQLELIHKQLFQRQPTKTIKIILQTVVVEDLEGSYDQAKEFFEEYLEHEKTRPSDEIQSAEKSKIEPPQQQADKLYDVVWTPHTLYKKIELAQAEHSFQVKRRTHHKHSRKLYGQNTSHSCKNTECKPRLSTPGRLRPLRVVKSSGGCRRISSKEAVRSTTPTELQILKPVESPHRYAGTGLFAVPRHSYLKPFVVFK